MTSLRESSVSSLRRRTSCSCTASAVAAPAIAGRLKRCSPCIGSDGLQTRSSATMAPADSSEATMSVISTER